MLVTGASGAVGPAVVAAFQSRGYTVRTLTRHPISSTDRIDSRIGDVTDRNAVMSAVAGVNVVVHLAATLHVLNPDTQTIRAYERVNIDGTRIVAEASAASGVDRLVHLSTIAVYGTGAQREESEYSEPCPETPYASSKLESERAASIVRPSDGTPLSVVLRAAAVYGPHIKGNYLRLVRGLARGRFVPIGAGENRRALIFDRDLASAVVLAAEAPAAAGRVYNVSDGEEHRLSAIIGAITAALGRRPPNVHVPTGVARRAAALADVALSPLGSRRSFAADLDKYFEDIVVDSGRIRRELGFGSEYGLSAGWRATVEELRLSGAL